MRSRIVAFGGHRGVRLAAGGAALAAVVGVAGDARAQSFPGPAGWTALEKSGAVLTDASGDGSPAHNDAIGDAANAAVSIATDGSWLYFRVRVNADPQNNVGNWRSAWGCAIDTDGVSNTYEFLAALDGSSNTDVVVWRANTVTTSADSPAENADATPYSVPASGNAERVPVSGTIYLVDWAIPWTAIDASITPGTSIRFACGSGNGTNVGTDPIAGNTNNAAATLTGMWSTPYVCTSAAGCLLDTDGDSVPDAVETALGTDKTKKDTDGDGISDDVELRASAGAPFSAVDTDSDNTIDAKDLDSDNDCVTDAVEGATSYRDGTKPNGDASLNCANPTPVCDTATGACSACAADRGGGSGACYSSAAPACQTAGGLAGSCTECKPSLTTLCTTAAAPACDATTGACSACNGDNGTNATAVCPSAASPACHTSGALAGMCKVCSATNASLCTTPASPACDPASGSCAPCDGDHGGGTTKGCPTSAKPYCTLSGASAGTCGTCTSNAQCGTGHAGPTCDIPTGACVDKDSDGDGLNDSVEKILGTDFEKRDSDGDGIDDLTEVTFVAAGSPSKIDTDADGTIDALDADSDADGVPDAVEGAVDVDSDTVPSFRDLDDDGDSIPTATEILLAQSAGLPDDVDGDGLKNIYDTDADGDGKGDLFEGTGDADEDGVANFLDTDDKTTKPFDAGAPIAPGPTSPNGTGASSGSSGAADDGVVEGSGFACSTTQAASRASPSSTSAGAATLVVLALATAAAAARRRRRGG